MQIIDIYSQYFDWYKEVCADKTENYKYSMEITTTFVTYSYMAPIEFSKHLVHLYLTDAVYGLVRVCRLHCIRSYMETCGHEPLY